MRRVLFSSLLRTALVVVTVYVGVLAALCMVHRQGRPLVHWFFPELHWKGGDTWQRYTEFDAQRRSHFDAIVIGSSHAYRGYDPAIFRAHGHSFFNLGSSAQTPLHSLRIVREVIDSSNTGLLIFDCYDIMMEADPLEATSDLTMNLPWDRPAWSMGLAQRDPRGLLLLAVRSLLHRHAPVFTDSTYRPGGYCETTDSLRHPVWYKPKDRWKPYADMKESFIALLDLCRERGVAVVLVNHPAPSTANRKKHAAFAEWVRSVAEPRHVPFIDLAFDHGLPLSDHDHFYDHNHLNKAGVRIFDEELIRRLERAGLLH